MSEQIDIGSGVRISFYGWHPDRDLNPQYADLPDIDRAGILIEHPQPRAASGLCEGSVMFDSPGARRVFGNQPLWTVQSLDPLTISPSILCKGRMPDGQPCNFHGFIRSGKWVSA